VVLERYIEESLSWLHNLPLADVRAAIDVLYEAAVSGRTIYLFGNGGSASTASHFACDLGKNTLVHGTRLRAVALTDNMALFSAYANDEGYANVFAEQLRTLVMPGDVVVAISGSGNSPNVLAAVEVAHEHGAHSLALTGMGGGRLAPLVDVAVVVPSDRMEQVEDAHLFLEHMICQALGERVALAERGVAPAEMRTPLIVHADNGRSGHDAG
jgi:D-sedoheptulose 7-phosphate isomerase